MTTTKRHKAQRAATLKWVPIESMKVSPLAQRELRQPFVDHIAADFDLEQLGTPTVNARDDAYYVIDGQHRIEALKQIGWGDQQVQCWTYEGLTEQEEAERFLKLNDTLSVDTFSKFTIAVQAGRQVEVDIDRIVRANGLRVTRNNVEGAVHAVGTLRKIYQRSGPAILARTLRVCRDAYGTGGLGASVVDGIGLVIHRYGLTNDDEEKMVKRLSTTFGGVNGLLNQAETLRQKTGNSKGHCVAAAVVDALNRGRGGFKLANWWKVAEA